MSFLSQNHPRSKKTHMKKILYLWKLILKKQGEKRTSFTCQVIEWEKNCQKLEAKVFSLRIVLEKSKAKMDTNINLIKGSEALNYILINLRSPTIKTCLGYTNPQETLEGESSTRSSGIEAPICYENEVRWNTNEEKEYWRKETKRKVLIILDP